MKWQASPNRKNSPGCSGLPLERLLGFNDLPRFQDCSRVVDKNHPNPFTPDEVTDQTRKWCEQLAWMVCSDWQWSMGVGCPVLMKEPNYWKAYLTLSQYPKPRSVRGRIKWRWKLHQAQWAWWHVYPSRRSTAWISSRIDKAESGHAGRSGRTWTACQRPKRAAEWNYEERGTITPRSGFSLPVKAGIIGGKQLVFEWKAVCTYDWTMKSAMSKVRSESLFSKLSNRYHVVPRNVHLESGVRQDDWRN